MPEPMPLLKGTLDLLVLKTLTWGPMHGYGIASWLEGRGAGELKLDDSALYQALQRLEARELISAEWGLTENNRRARWYTLTANGRQQLREEVASWRRYARVVGGILAVAGRGGR